MIKIEKKIPDWGLEKFIELLGYTYCGEPKFSYEFSDKDLRINSGRPRTRYIKSSNIKLLYTLIKKQESYFYRKFISGEKISSQVFSVSHDAIELECPSTNSTESVGTDDSLFIKFMGNLYDKYKSNLLRRLEFISKNSRCSYCQVSRPNTLDHFLPKSHFPLLAISPLNLIPSCSECNSSISTKNKYTDTQALIYPYGLKTDRTGCLTFTFNNGGHFPFILDGFKNDSEVERHIATTGITRKWNGMALSEISDMIEMADTFVSKISLEEIDTQLKINLAQKNKTDKVAEKILYSAMLDEKNLSGFMEYLISHNKDQRITPPSLTNTSEIEYLK
ncbi:HNH endonuclease, partial [Rothia sp. P5766]|uniref:HNH endonuclease n=1 Tax=Rothia sp. P5766 TaxID=3402656 RepID=UPI003AE0D1CA